MKKKSLLLVVLMLVGVHSILLAEPVIHMTNGEWVYASGNSPAYWEEKGFWVDVKVEDFAYEKEVGIRWTDNNWETYQESLCSYEGALESGYEQWGITFEPLGKLDSYYIGSWTNYVTGITHAGGSSVTIEYAVFYRVNSEEYWDNNNGNNYSRTLSLQ